MTLKPETRVVQAGNDADPAYRSVAAPIYQTSTFRYDDDGVPGDFGYSRIDNPTRAALEQLLADLEGGTGALATASGMAAIATVLDTFDAGIHVISCHDCYGGTGHLLTLLARQKKIELSFVDLNDEAALRQAVKPTTRLLWIETPSNPLLRVLDLAALADFAKARGITTVVDNTFLSPYFQRPLDFGIDMVVHSTTKYLNGHADVVGGAVVVREPAMVKPVQDAARSHGGIAAPFDCWLVLRGIKTLAVRMAAHERNALAVARFLETHPVVAQVFYPGLRSHPSHALAQQQQQGFGGMVSLRLKGGGAAARRLLPATRMFALAESLGGVESLIGYPTTMSHGSMSAEWRERAGITDDVIRLSVGIEAIDDLLADLEQSLAGISA